MRRFTLFPCVFAGLAIAPVGCSSTPPAADGGAAEISSAESSSAPMRTVPGSSAPDRSIGSPAGALTYRPGIDRVISFRAPDGSEMLFTNALDQPPSADEDYTFYGGAYTWTAPQNGELGWVGPGGASRAWPPDPAMDIGPATVTSESERTIVSVTPTNRLGLIEQKRFEMTDTSLEVTYTLRNTTDKQRTAGTWINTAVHSDAYIAVRLVGPDALATIRGWDTSSIDRFVSVADRQGNGWALVNLSKAAWDGGIKVYLPTPSGELPTIAIWREGRWLLRAQKITEQSTNTVGRLETLGEGAVAVYIQPSASTDPMIVEAELYGPIVDIPANGAHSAGESWITIASPGTPDTSVLPVFKDPAAN